MTGFETVAKVGEIPEGEGIAYLVNGRLVAVFNDGGQYQAIDDFCPHMGASLAGGFLDEGIVACPWHAWRFRVSDGTWCDNPTIKIDHFDVRVEDDQIQVKVPPKEDAISEGPSREEASREEASREEPSRANTSQPDRTPECKDRDAS